jgi:tetratricopeptide (TPR) repeat protein
MSGRALRCAAILAAGVLGSLAAQDPARENPFKPFDRAAFEAHVASLGASEDQLQQFAKACEDGQADLGADALMRALVIDLEDAAKLGESGDPRGALALAKLVTSTQDVYVRAHARYHLGRVLLDGEDPEGATEVLRDYLRNDRNKTPLDAEAAFFFASALADVPMREHAVAAFTDYLELFPAAPERFRAVAQQRRAELEAQFESPLHDVADEMKRCERDIKKLRTGDPTQGVQKDIVEKLQKIIEEMEEREKKAGGSPGGNGPSQSPATKSALPEGAGRIGQLGKAPPVGERWDVLKDRDREEIGADLNTGLPSRYREILEGYYKRLNRAKNK